MAIIKYIITDDHKIFRKGVKLSLAGDHKLKCIGEADSGIELLQLLDKSAPDVILLDIRMPLMDGVQALDEIKKKYPDVKVLMLTMHDDEQLIIHLMEAGANGYLLKNAEPEEIINAIYTVYENEYYFSDLVSTTLLKTVVQKVKVPPKFKEAIALNDKEIAILRLICAERTAAEIAKDIFLSPRTVEGIRSALLEKIGARNTAGLVLYAVKNGIYQ